MKTRSYGMARALVVGGFFAGAASLMLAPAPASARNFIGVDVGPPSVGIGSNVPDSDNAPPAYVAPTTIYVAPPPPYPSTTTWVEPPAPPTVVYQQPATITTTYYRYTPGYYVVPGGASVTYYGR